MAIKLVKVALGAARGAWPLLGAVWYLGAHFAYPFSYYYDLGQIFVDPNPAKAGEVHLNYNGGAVRDFRGKYNVVARRFQDSGIACDASSAPFNYKRDAQRPAPLTMTWWAPSDPRCSNLPAGAYTIETCWTVVDRGWWGLLPDITDCITTPIFRVH